MDDTGRFESRRRSMICISPMRTRTLQAAVAACIVHLRLLIAVGLVYTHSRFHLRTEEDK